MPELVSEIDFGLAPFAICYCARERASAQTQCAALIIYVHQYVFEALPADHFAGGVPGQLLCTLVPVGNSSLAINEVNAIMQAVQQSLVKRWTGFVWRRNRFGSCEIGHIDLRAKTHKSK
jgi:hypothetical protein